MSVNPKLLVALGVVIVIAGVLRLSNPYREYSRAQFWENAPPSLVATVPQEALKAGNRNGPVLMWAAIGADDPGVIDALVDRGADPNEHDILFTGTPLTGAAGYARNPEILRRLVQRGARLDELTSDKETALIIAAQHNPRGDIVQVLIDLGIDVAATDRGGRTALDHAKANNNSAAVEVLERYWISHDKHQK